MQINDNRLTEVTEEDYNNGLYDVQGINKSWFFKLSGFTMEC